MTLDDVLAVAEQRAEHAVGVLKELARIPSVSAAGFDAQHVARSARACADAAAAVGLQDAQVLELEGAHPAAFAQWRGAQAPTVLLYAHHDVQPPGRVEKWDSPPFEPVERDGRLYGRGVVDDKAGLVVHLAAVDAWLRARGSLPVNVKLFVEGEEEVGSVNLPAFLARERQRLAADVMVLTDTANLDAGIPSITTSLRGLVTVNIAVSAARTPLHSGMWGGPVPDAAHALSVVLARLVSEDGSVNVPGLEELVPAVDDATAERLKRLPFRESAFRAQAGLLPGVPLAGEYRRRVYERLWLRPAIAINALEASSMAGASNQLVDVARARVGLRLPAGVDPVRARDLLLAQLKRLAPAGLHVTLESDQASPGWRTDAQGPAFEAAARALQAGYGQPAAFIGCGATIPFVQPLSDALGGVPALLLGLEDPLCLAHAENESLLLADFRRAIRSAIHLYDELARALPRTPEAA